MTVAPETVTGTMGSTLAPLPHAAAPVIAGTSHTPPGVQLPGITIILGMMMILSGLLLHALLLLRMRTERTVAVHGKERHRETVERSARMQRAIEVFWVEQEIRL